MQAFDDFWVGFTLIPVLLSAELFTVLLFSLHTTQVSFIHHHNPLHIFPLHSLTCTAQSAFFLPILSLILEPFFSTVLFVKLIGPLLTGGSFV